MPVVLALDPDKRDRHDASVPHRTALEVKNKAAGINVDLWAGLAMLVFAALMLTRAFARAVAPEPTT